MVAFPFLICSSMAGLEELWSRFSLIEEEEGGAEVSHHEEAVIHRLAGKYFTKRVLNIDGWLIHSSHYRNLVANLRSETSATVFYCLNSRTC